MARSTRERRWQLQAAKNKFSEVIEEARAHGPQVVTRRGKETAVILSFDDYQRLMGREAPAQSFTDFLLSIPKAGGGLVVDRDRDTGRSVDL